MGIEKTFFDKALEEIKQYRNPRAARPENKDLRLFDVKKMSVIDLCDSDLERYGSLVDYAKQLTASSIAHILSAYLEVKKVPHKVDFKISEDIPMMQSFVFSITDLSTKVLYIFKEVEKENFFLSKDFHKSFYILK